MIMLVLPQCGWVLVWPVTKLGCSLEKCFRVIVILEQEDGWCRTLLINSSVHSFSHFIVYRGPDLLYRWRNKIQERRSDLPKVTLAQG